MSGNSLSLKAYRLAGLTAAFAAALYCPSLLAQQDDAQHQGHDMSTMDANAPVDPHAHHHMTATDPNAPVDPHAGHDMSAMDPNAPVDPHAHHHADMDAQVMRSMVDVKIAATPLVRQDGARTTLAKELGGKKPTVLAFIYTSCTTVCPVTSQILSRTQDLLGADLAKARIVSISIDPEYDTPQRLSAYSEKFGAQPQWQHYTGSLANSVAVQKAFGAFRGDKMNHVPLFFINGGGKAEWVQLEGFPSAEQLVKEFREQAGS